MFKRFAARMTSFLHPFWVIAQKLSIIAELYELELANRNPPIRRVTEEPSQKDTEVTYAGVVDDPRKRADFFETEDWE